MMAGYNTNLAAEFYVLSMLHRLGADANLTLGNKKSVDIAVVQGTGDAITVDVKGLASSTGFPIDNVSSMSPKHFLVFVSYMGKIGELEFAPRCWVVPSVKLQSVTFQAPGGRKLASLKLLKAKSAHFENAWHLIT